MQSKFFGSQNDLKYPKINKKGKILKQVAKAYNTRYSQAVTHPSTNRARGCLTSVIGRELGVFNQIWS